jgi:hypothetical protein
VGFRGEQEEALPQLLFHLLGLDRELAAVPEQEIEPVKATKNAKRRPRQLGWPGQQAQALAREVRCSIPDADRITCPLSPPPPPIFLGVGGVGPFWSLNAHLGVRAGNQVSAELSWATSFFGVGFQMGGSSVREGGSVGDPGHRLVRPPYKFMAISEMAAPGMMYIFARQADVL